jgi:hypothetical protein
MGRARAAVKPIASKGLKRQKKTRTCREG